MPTKSEIAAMVQKHLDGQTLGDIYFEVDEPSILTGEGWVRVPVRPSHLPKKLYTLYEFLSEKQEEQEEIVEAENFNLLLMSGEALFEDEPKTAVLTN